MVLGSRSDKAGQGRAGRRETTKDTSGARVVDGWGFSLGLGNRITRDYAVAERPISSKCYATGLRLVRGLAGGAVLCSSLL